MDDSKKHFDELRGEDKSEFLDLIMTHILGVSKNSKKQQKSSISEDKSVQADWTMLIETRDCLQELHSSTPNLSDENKKADVRQVRRSVSDSEEDDEKQKILTKIHKLSETSRQREDNLMAHLRDYRGRMEDLRRKIALRDSNIERLEAEICRLKEVLVEYRGKENEMHSLISDLQLNISDQEAQYDEDMTLCQLREAELKHTIDELTVVNKHLRTENARLNIELLQRPSKRSQVMDGKHSSLEVNASVEQPLIHNRQSRSFDTLSSAASSPQHDNRHHHQPSPPSYQISKPTDQRVFLNGRIIMSHSTNLQQALRMHADVLDFTNTKQGTPEKVEPRNRSKTRGDSEKVAHNCNIERETSTNNKIMKSEANRMSNVFQNQKPSKHEGQGRCDVSPFQKRHTPSKLSQHFDNDQQSSQQQQHHHHHQQQPQQHSIQTKQIRQQSKSPQNQAKLETRT